MGVKDLWNFLDAPQRRLEGFKSKSVAVDGNLRARQLAHATGVNYALVIRGDVGPLVHAFLSRLRQWLCIVGEVQIVFDGATYPAKKAERLRRREAAAAAKDEAIEIMKLPPSERDEAKVRRLIGAATSINTVHTLALQRAILIHFADRKGVFVFHALFEADAVLAGLAQDRVVDAVVTEDSDLALYQRVSVIAKARLSVSGGKGLGLGTAIPAMKVVLASRKAASKATTPNELEELIDEYADVLSAGAPGTRGTAGGRATARTRGLQVPELWRQDVAMAYLAYSCAPVARAGAVERLKSLPTNLSFALQTAHNAQWEELPGRSAEQLKQIADGLIDATTLELAAACDVGSAWKASDMHAWIVKELNCAHLPLKTKRRTLVAIVIRAMELLANAPSQTAACFDHRFRAAVDGVGSAETATLRPAADANWHPFRDAAPILSQYKSFGDDAWMRHFTENSIRKRILAHVAGGHVRHVEFNTVDNDTYVVRAKVMPSFLKSLPKKGPLKEKVPAAAADGTAEADEDDAAHAGDLECEVTGEVVDKYQKKHKGQKIKEYTVVIFSVTFRSLALHFRV
ncbi:PIN domain-like protein [Pelagophyceae sp. CCMP2097]|nr:PIN domain-like protein [Pelagophyceae sp. CCMP2097]